MAFDAVVRIDTPSEAEYYRHGGILQYVLRKMLEQLIFPGHAPSPTPGGGASPFLWYWPLSHRVTG